MKGKKFKKTSYEKSTHQAPKIIHFIWAGGNGLMEHNEVSVVAEWCRANPICDVILWVDKKFSGGLGKMTDNYSKLFSEHHIPVISGEMIEQKKEPCLQLRDIGDFADPIYESEINQIHPNYGCSSDILRLRILYKHGGCYFDQDVSPNPLLPLQESDVFKPRKKHVVILEHHPQRPTPEKPFEYYSGDLGSVVYLGSSSSVHQIEKSSEDKTDSSSDEAVEDSSRDSIEQRDSSESSSDNSYSRFLQLTLNELGNDAIITTPGNPLIKTMLDKTIANYQLNKKQWSRIIAECYGGHDRKNRTIERTGPTIQQTVIREIPHLSLNIAVITLHSTTFEGDAIEFEAMRTKERELTCPMQNFQHWLKVDVKKIPGAHQCIKILLERIKFEVKHFNILRLDDHLHLMIKSMSLESKPEIFKKNAELLITDIAKLDLHNVLLTKITFQFSQTVGFCQKQDLKTFLDLDANDCYTAISCMTQMNELSQLMKSFSQMQVESTNDLDDLKKDEKTNLDSVKFLLENTVRVLTILMKSENLMQMPHEAQQTLCQFIMDNKDVLEYAAKVFSPMNKNLVSDVVQCLTSAEKHPMLPNEQKPIKALDENVSKDDKQADNTGMRGRKY